MLKIDALSVTYGGLLALDEVSIHADEGEFIAIVGPNGAGKSTLFKAISGTVPAAGGTITLDGADLLSVPPPMRPHRGIAHVPEGRQVFKSLSVADNIAMGAWPLALGVAEWTQTLERLHALFPVLAERRDQLAGTLSGGEQQMLAIARALAGQPRLLLLDEPSMGLSPRIADLIFDCIQTVHKTEGMTVVLVEQRAVEALSSCDRGYVLESGRVVLQGSQSDLLGDDRVRKAYLGR
jgi:branched-chain amino acid transport system ATP-binding protein